MIGLLYMRLAMGFFTTPSLRSGLLAQNDRGMAVGLQHKGHCEELHTIPQYDVEIASLRSQ